MKSTTATAAAAARPDAWTKTLPPHIRSYRIALYCFSATGAAALAAAILFELWVRTSNLWPEEGDFSLLYHFLLIEYGLATAAIFHLLQSRHWAERFRRKEASQYKTLLIFALVRDLVHFGLLAWAAGPASVWLMAACLASGVAVFTLTPRRLAVQYATALLVAYGALLAASLAGGDPPAHPLAPAFHAMPSATAPWLFAFVAAPLIASLAVGRASTGAWAGVSACFDSADAGSTPNGILPRGRFLVQLQEEIERSKREIDGLSVIVVEVGDLFSSDREPDDPVYERAVEITANAVLKSIRIEEDTVGQLAWNQFAVILPEAGSVNAHTVASRIRLEIGAATKSDGALSELALRIATATTAWPVGVTSDGLLGAALNCLQDTAPSVDISISRVIVEDLDKEVPYPTEPAMLPNIRPN
ncbi:MAG: hypothetical protein AB1405_12390 [Bdellovibrionota bacterium]